MQCRHTHTSHRTQSPWPYTATLRITEANNNLASETLVQPFGCSSGRFSSLDRYPGAAIVRLHILEYVATKVFVRVCVCVSECAARGRKKFDFGKHRNCCCRCSWWWVWTHAGVSGRWLLESVALIFTFLTTNYLCNHNKSTYNPVTAHQFERPSKRNPCGATERERGGKEWAYAAFCLCLWIIFGSVFTNQMPTGNFVYK